MANLQFRDHLNHNVVEVFAALHVFQHGQVLIIDSGPVDAMHIRIIEIFFLHAPGIIKDLLPLAGGIDKAAYLA